MQSRKKSIMWIHMLTQLAQQTKDKTTFHLLTPVHHLLSRWRVETASLRLVDFMSKQQATLFMLAQHCAAVDFRDQKRSLVACCEIRQLSSKKKKMF